MDEPDDSKYSRQRASSRVDHHRSIGELSGGRGDTDPSATTRPRDGEGERPRVVAGTGRWLLESDTLPIAVSRTVDRLSLSRSFVSFCAGSAVSYRYVASSKVRV